VPFIWIVNASGCPDKHELSDEIRTGKRKVECGATTERIADDANGSVPIL
jgi:hypothetical protein